MFDKKTDQKDYFDYQKQFQTRLYTILLSGGSRVVSSVVIGLTTGYPYTWADIILPTR